MSRSVIATCLCLLITAWSCEVLATPAVSDVTWIKFDEYSELSNRAERARLQNLLIELRAWKNAEATIVAYGGKNSCVNEAQIRAARVRQFLVNVGGIDLRRIKIVDAGYLSQWTISLYIAPSGVAPLTVELLNRIDGHLESNQVRIQGSCEKVKQRSVNRKRAGFFGELRGRAAQAQRYAAGFWVE